MSLATSTIPRTDAAEIPILDLAPYLSGEAGAREKLGKELCHALENIGFYFIKGHGVPQSLVDAAFAETERFHAQLLDRKMRLRRNRDNVGYLPMSRAADSDAAIKPNVNEAFFLKRDLPADHPDVLAHKRFRGTNIWPDDLPGFREIVVAYCDALEALVKKLVPLYAVALDLPADHFDEAFAEPQYTLRMTHYPYVEVLAENEFGIAPHSDTSFLTLLAQNKVPGLSRRGCEGKDPAPCSAPAGSGSSYRYAAQCRIRFPREPRRTGNESFAACIAARRTPCRSNRQAS